MVGFPSSSEQEELRLGAHIKPVKAHGVGLLNHLFEHIPGVANEGGAVGVVHIADEPGHLAVAGPPGEDGEGVQVGVEVLVRLVNADKALDGGAVEHDLVVHRLFDLRGGDGHIFQLAEDVRELEADKLNILLLHHADDVFFGVRHAGHSLHSFKKGDKGEPTPFRSEPLCPQLWVQL